MWARRARRAHRARRARGHVEHVGHLGPLGTPFSRLNLNEHGFQKQSFTNVLYNRCSEKFTKIHIKAPYRPITMLK